MIDKSTLMIQIKKSLMESYLMKALCWSGFIKEINCIV